MRRLGKGGMGEVYLGRDDALNRYVALKVMSRKLTADPNFVARFKREAQAAASVSHANLVQIFELDETKGFHFFAMEYVQGKTLEEELKEQGHLAMEQALDYIEQAARGLQAAARKSLIHRDIKPSNIMIDDDRVVKLTDFGLAKALQDDSKLTQSDVILGTPHYVSPEQARGESSIDHRSDMYSLGVTLFEALSSQLPFQASTPMGVMLRHVNDPVPDIAKLRSNLPWEIVEIVKTLLSKKACDRFQSYDELLSALQGARRAIPPESPRDNHGPKQSQEERPLQSESLSAASTKAQRSVDSLKKELEIAETVVKHKKSEPHGESNSESSTEASKSSTEASESSAETSESSTEASKSSAEALAKLPSQEQNSPSDRGSSFLEKGFLDSVKSVVLHPSHALSELSKQEQLRWWPITKLAITIWLLSQVATRILWNPRLVKAVQSFLNLDILLSWPVLAFLTSSSHRHGRLIASLHVIILSWCLYLPIAIPIVNFIIFIYPYYLYKALRHYLKMTRWKSMGCTAVFSFLLLIRAIAGLV